MWREMGSDSKLEKKKKTRDFKSGPTDKLHSVSHRTRGRPTALTPELQNKICNALRLGCYIETAVTANGVSKQAFYNWLKRGNRQKKGIYREFVDAVQKAMADAEIRDLLKIDKASDTNWQAAAWKLERKFPKKWGRREMVRLSTGEDEDFQSDEENIHADVVDVIEQIEAKNNEKE